MGIRCGWVRAWLAGRSQLLPVADADWVPEAAGAVPIPQAAPAVPHGSPQDHRVPGALPGLPGAPGLPAPPLGRAHRPGLRPRHDRQEALQAPPRRGKCHGEGRKTCFCIACSWEPFLKEKKYPKMIRCLFRKALLFIPTVLSTPGSRETSAGRRGATSKGDECQESQRRSRKETPSTWGLITFWGSVCSPGISFAP